MNTNEWDAKLKSFLKKAGEDFKRAGNDIKAEAEKLLKEVQDPERQAKVKAGMKEFGTQARKAAEQMAELMETGVKKAEGVLTKATDRVVDFTVGQKPERAGGDDAPLNPDPTPPNPPEAPAAEAKEAKPAGPAKKSIGGKKRKPSTKKAAAKKKSLGKKGAPPAENNAENDDDAEDEAE